MRKIIIGSRGSDLALWQANFVQNELKKIKVDSEIKIIKTRGDQIQHLSFEKMEGKGFFTKEIEDALLNKEIDLAVHSHKDLETSKVDGLVIAAVSYREDPRDVLLIRKEAVDIREKFNLKNKAVIGTSSARRKNQISFFRPDLEIKDLRGNVPTRIEKLRSGEYDSILLASAGVTRLNLDLSDLELVALEPEVFIPAPAQGVLGLQTRENDSELNEILKELNHEDVAKVIKAERELLRSMEGGCQLPLGAHCKNQNGELHFWASIGSTTNNTPFRIYLKGENPEKIAHEALSQFRKEKTKSVFITRSQKESPLFFKTLIENGITTEGKKLITHSPIPFEKVPATDWIFFSSKQCVKHFISRYDIPKGIKIGSIGGATSEELKRAGIIPDFIGLSNDTEEIGRHFAEVIGEQTSLFPISTASYRTIQKQFKDQSKVFDLIIYDTIPSEIDTIPNADIYVVTSPTNAIALLRKINGQEKIFISIGKSTHEQLKILGIDSIISWNTNELALAETVSALI